MECGRLKLPVVLLPWALCASTPAVQAQQLGTIVGIVGDSLNGGPLREALVLVEDQLRATMTDSTGRFVIDSVPAGRHRLHVAHPILDTLGLSLVTPSHELRADDTLAVVIAVPSARTIAAIKCGGAARAYTGRALLGMIVDADSLAPIEGASIAVEWTELERTPNGRLRDHRHRRNATTTANGRFTICDLPPQLIAEARVRHRSDSTALLPVVFGPRTVLLTSLALPRARDTAQVATLWGRVSVNDRPVVGARVEVSGARRIGITDSAGFFEMTVAAGSRRVGVYRVGYDAVETAMTFRAGARAALDARMSTMSALLPDVAIAAMRDSGLVAVGFSARHAEALGYLVTPEQIARRAPRRVSDLLVSAPMLTVLPGDEGARVIRGRQMGDRHNCVAVFIDGERRDAQPDDILDVREVGAVEVYVAGFAPPQFQTAGEECETVVIWTNWKLGAW